MGQVSQHPGHKSEAWARIEKAREHYKTRAERRPVQTWPVGPREGKRRGRKEQG